MIRKLIFGFSALIFLSQCGEKDQGVYSESVECQSDDWIENAVLYEVNTRNVTPEGTFAAFESHLPRLKEMGVDILWFMPINPISKVKRKATNDKFVTDFPEEERGQFLGSPYAIGNYKEVNPDLGSMDEFKHLVNTAHELCLKVIIDWVPNHTGWDNPWISEHPGWYTTDEEGNIIDPIDYNTGKSWGWTDVADLNYDVADMRTAMIENMAFWIEEADIDGFRVDVAHGIPDDFWEQTRDSLSKLEKDLFMLAESEVPHHRNSEAFHATYGWSFHHLMNELAHEKKGASDVKAWYEQDTVKFRNGFHIHFTSNHDENTWAGTVFDRMGDAHKAMAVIAATFQGMPLLYNGQEAPLDVRLPFFVKDTIDWKDYGYTSFYKTLFSLKDECSALGNINGSPTNFIGDNDEVLIYTRENEDCGVLVAVNLSGENQTIELPPNYSLENDVFNGAYFDNKEASMLNLHPHGFLAIKS